MRIALLIEYLDGGGSERVIQRLACGLSRRGHHVFVYCLGPVDTPTHELRSSGVVLREARSVGRDPLLLWRLARWLRCDGIQIVHAHSCAALVRVFPVARLLNLALVHIWHGWPLGRPSRDHRLARRLDLFVERVVINSESLRQKLPMLLRRTAVYIPNGIDLEPTSQVEARRLLSAFCGPGTPLFDGPIILSVGNIRPEKDICGLLRAVARVRQVCPQVRLVCIGAAWEQAYWHEVTRTRRELGLERTACFPGPVADAWRLMAGADVLCLSSRSEALPNVILEAMSQRAPIVATAVGDVGRLRGTGVGDRAGSDQDRWLLRHNETALLVPPGDPAALADALACALRDRQAALRRADAAWSDCRRRFSATQMALRYESLYRSCRRSRPVTAGTRRRPRVLMLGPAWPAMGGMVTSIDLLMRSPLRRRYEMHRLSTPIPAGTGFSASDGGPHDGVSAARRLLGIARHCAAGARLVSTLLRARIDLVHIHTCSYLTFYRSLIDLVAAKLLGRAVVLHIRGGQFAEFCEKSGRLGRELIRRGLEAADAVLVLSRGWRRRLRPYAGRARLLAVPNAVEIETRGMVADRGLRASGAGWSPDDRIADVRHAGNGARCRFLYLAPLTVAKGLGDLLAAAALLRRDGLAFELAVAGPAVPEVRQRWERRARELGLEGCIAFRGPVTGIAKAELLAWADCFVHPSHSEGMPNAVLEAAAAGLPVIATAVGAVPELMQPRRGVGQAEPLSPLVLPHDPAALAREMKRLAGDARLRRRLGRALRQHVATNYSIAAVAECLGRVYDEVLGQTADRRVPPRVQSSKGKTEACQKPTPGLHSELCTSSIRTTAP